jgi:hypothetical protein
MEDHLVDPAQAEVHRMVVVTAELGKIPQEETLMLLPAIHLAVLLVVRLEAPMAVVDLAMEPEMGQAVEAMAMEAMAMEAAMEAVMEVRQDSQVAMDPTMEETQVNTLTVRNQAPSQGKIPAQLVKSWSTEFVLTSLEILRIVLVLEMPALPTLSVSAINAYRLMLGLILATAEELHVVQARYAWTTLVVLLTVQIPRIVEHLVATRERFALLVLVLM